jgi:hypothetical protein
LKEEAPGNLWAPPMFSGMVPDFVRLLNCLISVRSVVQLYPGP